MADIIATVGATNANSFVTEDEMEIYCLSRLNATIWDGGDAQNIALIEATRDLNLLPWLGARASSTQALAWPRTDVINPDLVGVHDGTLTFDLLRPQYMVTYEATIIPQRVKDATMEWALQYLKLGTTDLAVADDNAGIIEEKIGPITTKWASPQDRPTGFARHPRILRYISPLLASRGSGLRLVRT